MTPIPSTRRLDTPPSVQGQLLSMFGANATLAYQRGLGYVVRLQPEKDYIPVLSWHGKQRPTQEDKTDLLAMHGVLIGGRWQDWDHVKAWLKDNAPVKAVVVEGFWNVEQLPLGLAA